MENLGKRDFFKDVYDVVREIPRGRVCTYGSIAKFLGSPQSARMVGWAMNNAHNISPPVPAHRVVNRQGLLSGKMHFKEESMESLLSQEGVQISDNQISNFQTVFWDPSIELSLN